MAKMTNWGAQAERLRTDNANIPLMALSNIAVGTAELTAVARAEAVAGWPSAVVDRATIVRQRPYKTWLSPRGISISNLPEPRLLGHKDALNWALYANVSAYSKWGNKFGFSGAPTADSTTAQGRNQIASGMGKAFNFAGAGTMKCALEWMFKRVMPPGVVTKFASIGVAAWTDPMSFIRSEIAAGRMCIGVEDVETFPSAAQHLYIYSCERPVGWEGIGCLIYNFAYRSSWVTNNTGGLAGSLPSLAFVLGEPIWKEILDTLTERTIRTYAAGTSTRSTLYGENVTSYLTRAIYYEPMPAKASPVYVYPAWPRMVEGDNQGTGLSLHTTYSIGRPEWMDGVHVLGDVTVNNKDINVANATMSLEWSGQRIVELSGSDQSITQAQKDNLTSLRIRSFIHNGQVKVPDVLIDKLKMKAMADEAGTDLRAEKMFEATYEADGTTVAEPALTFQQAEDRAKNADATMVHQLLSFETYDLPYRRINITGTSSAYQVVAIGDDGYTAVAEPDLDLMVASIKGGCQIVNTAKGITTDQALEGYLGISASAVYGAALNDEDIGEFDEATMFGLSAPDVTTVPENFKAGFYLLQFGRPRKQLSSVVISALIQARQNYRRVT